MKLLMFIGALALRLSASDYRVIQNAVLNINVLHHVSHAQDLQMSHSVVDPSGKTSNCLGQDGADSSDTLCDMDTSTIGTYNFTVNSTDQLGMSNSKSISVEVYDPVISRPVMSATSTSGNFERTTGFSSSENYSPSYNPVYGGMEFAPVGYGSFGLPDLSATKRPTRLIIEARTEAGYADGLKMMAPGCTGTWNFVQTPAVTIDTNWRTFDLAFASGNANPLASTFCNYLLQFNLSNLGGSKKIFIRRWEIY